MDRKRIAGYIRVSTEDQSQRVSLGANSLETQRQAIEWYCKMAYPGSFICVYQDIASGRRADREALDLLEVDIANHNVDVVVVYMLDRLARSVKYTLEFFELLKKHGVAFVSVTEHIDTSTPAGQLMTHIISVFAQYFSDQHAKRISDKVAFEAERGYWIAGSPPFGYVLKDKRLHPHPEYAPLVRRAFELYAATGSLSLVRRFLNANVSDRRDIWRRRKEFGTENVLYMLRNPTYLGDRILNGRVVCRQAFLPIVDRDLFDRVQAMLQGRKRVYAGSSKYRLYVLQGLVFCGQCGARMTPYHVKKPRGLYFYYVCSNKLKRGNCNQQYIAAEMIENAVAQAIGHAGSDPVLLASLVRVLTASQANELQDEIAREQQAVENLLKAIEIGGDIPQLVERLQQHQQNLKQLQWQWEYQQMEKGTLSVEHLRTLLEKISLYWDIASAEERRDMVLSVVNRVEVNGDHATVWVKGIRSGEEIGCPIIVLFEPHIKNPSEERRNG